MRRVVAWENMSLDGVVESPANWSFQFHNYQMEEAIGEAMAASDAMLLGRVTYEGFAAFWPSQGGEDDQGFAGYMNNPPKHVVSRTLQEPLEWQNSTLLEGNVSEELAKLKHQPDKDISITGSIALVRALLQDDLLDELRLMVHPIVVGSGKHLFREGGERKALELVDSKTFETGVVYLTYRPTHG